jgi:hypothetical protein
MATTADSFFVREGVRLRGTVMTRGPWNDAHQHGGPPSALLAGAVVKAEPEPGAFRLARFSVEYLRPVPTEGSFEIRVSIGREGKQVQRIEASLFIDDSEVVRSSALRIRTADLADPAAAAARLLPVPESAQPFQFPFFRSTPAYHTAMDIRIVEGQWGAVPIGAWGRPRVALIAGEETTAIERTLILADAESGVGPPLDVKTHTFVNPDLTVFFARQPRGEWIGLRVVSSAAADGIGLAESELFDEAGSFGRAAQSLLVRAR